MAKLDRSLADGQAKRDLWRLTTRGDAANSLNILYLAMNQANPDLADIRVRQAIAYAINKDALVAQTLPEGTEVATNFVPPTVEGYNKSVTTYKYDPDKAKALLAEAGKSNLTIDFNYPTNVSRRGKPGTLPSPTGLAMATPS